MPVYTQNTKGPQSQLSLHTICGILWQFQAIYYIRDATCFSNVAISTLKYFQLHLILSPIAPQCQIPIWYVFFLLLLSLSKRFAQKYISFICQNLSSVSDYPLKLSNVSHKICFQKVQTWCICTGPHPKSSKCCGVDDKILTKSESQS